MFERNSRRPYPLGTIILMALLAIVILGVVVFTMQKSNEQEVSDDTLFPAEWFYTLREYPDFKPDVKAYTEALREAKLRESVALPRGGSQGFSAPWHVEGPANIGARINTLVVHPTQPGTIYIGFSGGGLWKTTDHGQNWTSLFDEQTFLSIGTVVLDPSDPETVYVGTGDPNISGYPFIGDGIWKSTDGGANWSALGLEETYIVTQIIIDPENTQTIYAATMGLPFERTEDRGLYKSIDGGQNWEKILYISDECGVIDLVMSPDSSEVLYAAVWDRIRNNQESLVSGPNAKIWKTSDAGANWTMLQNGLPDSTMSRIALAINPEDGNHLLATYANTNLQFGGLWETLDGGLTWQMKDTPGLNDGFQGGFAWYFGKVDFNANNPDDIWILGVRSQRSQSGGAFWDQAIANNQGVHVDHHAMGFASDGTIYIGTDGGLYSSGNNGESWQQAALIPTTQFYRVAWNPFLPDIFYGGAQDNGTLAGNATIIEDWFRIYGGDGFQAAFHPENSNIFYAEWQNGRIVGTTDGGDTWDGATDGIDGDDRRHWDMPYIISNHNPDVMFAGTYRVYGSFGHLPQWGPISDDLTDGNIYGSWYHTISSVTESPIDENLLLVGTTDGNVWRGNPNTLQWTNITTGLPDRYVSSVKASPSDPNRIFVTQTGYKSNDFQARIHRSDDLGQTWIPVAGDLPDFAVNDIIILPGHMDSVLFAATDAGVYGSLNGGLEWNRLGQGMPFVPVYDLEFNPITRNLIAGTHARSIQSFPIDSLQLGADVSTYTPGTQLKPQIRLQPSICASSTTLFVENLPVREVAEVRISDLSGKIMWQGVSNGGPRSETALNVSQWAPGIYIVYAKTRGNVWASKKLVVAR